MKHSYFIILLMLLGAGSQAQKKCSTRFSSINQAGILKGSSDQAFQVQTINGVQHKTWFAGLGVGIDNYYFRTVPLFIDFRKNVFERKATPFFYVDLGGNIPWVKDDKNEWQKSDYKTGLYYEAGVGYTAPVKRRLSFNFSAGYSQKSLHETRSYQGGIIWDFPPYGGPGKEAYDYSFKRISVKVALQF